MSKVSFENYGRLAREVKDSTLASQRYPVQNEAIRRIVPDIVAKLTIGSKDRLLEIGCGVCVLLVPLSALVVEAVGVDHPDCVLRVRQGSPPVNLELVAGNFFDLKVGDISRHGRFDKIATACCIICPMRRKCFDSSRKPWTCWRREVEPCLETSPMYRGRNVFCVRKKAPGSSGSGDNSCEAQPRRKVRTCF